MEDHSQMSRIALFGGSFDPPHYGHIHATVFLQERHHIDAVYVVPSYRTVWKNAFYSPEKRLKMTRLAFAPVPHCTVLDIEIVRKADSYTIDTLRTLMEQDPSFASAQRYIFLGADVVPTLHMWKDYEELFSLVIPVIAARSSDRLGISPNMSSTIAQLVAEGWTDTGLLDISSTLIRERVSQNKYVDHLLPRVVLECMREEYDS
jgi:nicotinate-nucleotide adenylyltransferase